MSTAIPLVDLAAQQREVNDAVQADLHVVFERTAFIGGPDVGAFEAEYAQFCQVEHCVGMANGTDAVELSLRAVGVGLGARSFCRPTPSSRRRRPSTGQGPHPFLWMSRRTPC